MLQEHPPPKRKRGAPKGNLNALKTGRSSKQLQKLAQRIIDDPELFALLRVFLATPELRRTVSVRTGESYLRRIRRSKERERRRLSRSYEWLPYYDDGEAPWDPAR